MLRYLERASPAAVLLLLPAAWDATGLDMPLAQWAGTAQGFALRDDWWLSQVLHTGMQHAAWAWVVLLCAGVVWPVGPLAVLPFRRRVQLPAVALFSTACVALFKAFSSTSCPWDLAAFGGVARHVSHWSGWHAVDGGSGHCFPAGHASTGFAFVGGWFAWRGHAPAVARAWLLAAIAVGLVLGLSQQWRGAHFMSHTLWTAWLCWVLALLTDPLFAPAGPGSTA
jgi:membrane-associated PAP2 superfamily phosphatase